MATITILSDRGISSSEMLHNLDRFLTVKSTAETISVDCISRLKNLQDSLSMDTAQTRSDLPIDMPKSLRSV